MRILLVLPLLAAAAACNVDNDAANDEMTLQYNQERIEDAARDAARGARDVARGAGNVMGETGKAIRNEVGDIDVDVDVTRNRAGAAANEAAGR